MTIQIVAFRLEQCSKGGDAVGIGMWRLSALPAPIEPDRDCLVDKNSGIGPTFVRGSE